MELRDGLARSRRRAAGLHPRLAQLRQPVLHAVILRPARVVDTHRGRAAGPVVNAISRIGTRTPWAPSTSTFVELGNAVEKSDIPHSSAGLNRIRFQGFISIPVAGIPLAADLTIPRKVIDRTRSGPQLVRL